METTNRKPMHYVVIIPGLGDFAGHIDVATKNWHRSGLHPIVFPIGWRKHEPFEAKLQKLCTLVDKLSKGGSEISVVGCSAGGSAALNLFIERSHVLKNAVSVCGMLREGRETGFRSFKARTKASPAFAESVKLFESREHVLTPKQRKRILTLHAQFGDQMIPAETTTVHGAHNIAIPSAEHNLSVFLALSTFSKLLIKFLKS